MKTIDEVLAGEPAEVMTDDLSLAVPETAERPAVEQQTQSQPVSEAEKPTGERPAASPAATHDAPTIPLSAFKAVERRLKDAERLLKEREERPAQKSAPDVIEDPEGFQNHIRQDVTATILDTKVGLSEDFAKRTYPDFAEVMGTDEDGTHRAWIELVGSKPHLAAEFRNSPNPALFAYEEVKRHKALSDIGDPLTYRERLEAEIRAKLEAEHKAKPPADLPVPDTLAGEPSRAPRHAPAWNGPKPMTEILGKKRK